MDHEFLSVIDEKADWLDGIADYLWDNPETAFTEYRSAACLIDALRKEGFEVEENVAGISTAFSGRFGSGKPVIGILGEFDALSGLGQQSGALEKTPDGHDCGQGCGHNLFGAGSLGAAIAVKKWLTETKHSGTVIFYGTPGEEGGSGKAFMARDGAFDELDAAITWHPGDHTYVRTTLTLANYQILYRFDGLASHAGEHPHLGRSALDAVELMNMGVQFLREHIVTDARIHYAITDAGGYSPNVVQSHSEVLYLIRAPRNEQVKEIYERVNDIAKGAALMTGTKESHVFIKACSNIIPNTAIQRMLQEEMELIGPPEPDAADWEYAQKLTDGALYIYPDHDSAHPIHWELSPYDESEKQKFGSSDVGDTSWVCPTAQITTATIARGTPGHSWQVVAQGKLPLAHKMTRYAAKCMAAGVVRLMEDEKLMAEAKAEHLRRVGPDGYIPPIPKEVRPQALTAIRK